MGGGSSHFDAQDAERIRKKLSLPVLLAMKRGARFKQIADDHPATSAEIEAHVKEAGAITFTVDLVAAASLQISFLQTINLFPRLYGKENKSLFGVVAVRHQNIHDPDTVLDTRVFLDAVNKSSSSQLRKMARNMSSPKGSLPYVFADDLIARCLWRYEALWLPLCAKHPDKPLVPPLDVDWAWHCHTLCPHMYHKDCQAAVQKLVDRPIFDRGSDRINARTETMKLWARATQEPFHILGHESMPPVEKIPEDTLKEMEAFKTKLSYDVRASMKRQSAFIHQIDYSYIADQEYLEAAVSRYKQFLYVMKCDAGNFIVPTYDMDLMWHAHQMYPAAYLKDTTAAVGGLVNHDDSVNDRTPKGKLDTSANRTSSRWRQIFGEPQLRAYGAYRGAPNAPAVALNILVEASKHTRKIQKLQPSSLYDENTPPNSFHGHEKSQRDIIVANQRLYGLKPMDSFRVMMHIDKAYGLTDKSTNALHYTVTILSHTKSKLQVVQGQPVDGKECVFNTRHMLVCHKGEDYGLCFNLYRKKLLGHKLIGSCSMPFQTLSKSADLHLAGHLHLVDESDADAGELQVSLSLTPPDSENIIMSLGVPSKTKTTEEGVLVAEEYRLKSLRVDRSFHDQDGNSVFQVHLVNLGVMDDEEDPPSWTCFSLDSTKVLETVDDPSSIPPVATAQSCYNKYHLEVPGIPSLPLVATQTESIARRKQTMYIESGSTRLLLELRLAKSESDPAPFWFELVDVSNPNGQEYHLFAGRRYNFAGSGGPGTTFDDCVWTLVCHSLSSQTSHTLRRRASNEEVKIAPAASFLDRVNTRLKKDGGAAGGGAEQTNGRHAHSAAKHRHHPPVGMHTPYAVATIDVRGVLEANTWMDMAVVVAVAQSITHLVTQHEAVNSLIRKRFTTESEVLVEKSREYGVDYCGAYFGGCGAWYVGMGSLWYMNTSHHGFGNVAMPSTADGGGGFEGLGACDMLSGCGGDWTGQLGGMDLGIQMGGEFEIELDEIDVDLGIADGVADGFDFSGILDGILS